jgi:hypothetical protein
MPETLRESKGDGCPASKDKDGMLMIHNMGKVEAGFNKVYPCEPIPALRNTRCHFFKGKKLDKNQNAIVMCGYKEGIESIKKNAAEIRRLKAKIADNNRKIEEAKKAKKKVK